MIHTPICDLLGITHPIFNAPMAGTATAELAVAVSEAGGFGMIGGTSSGGAEWLRTQIRAVRARTTRPFGVGFISSFAGIEDLVQVALDEGVAAINHSFADPTPYVDAAHVKGVRIFTQVQSVAHAARAAQAGVDVIIAQGTEAGGHTGQAGTMALLPAVVEVVGSIPVVAAGGIADGRGLAAAFMLGAVGGWLGTRFVASREWAGGAWQQNAIVGATADDTVRTTVFDQIRTAPFPEGIADRVLRNAFITTWEGRTPDIEIHREALRREVEMAAQLHDLAAIDVSAGVAVGLVHSIEAAGTIVRTIVEEAEQILRTRYHTLLRDK